MKIEAWWFENTQSEKEILQPEWFTPKTHCGIYAEFERIEFPFHLSVQTFCKQEKVFFTEIDIDNVKGSPQFDLLVKDNAVLIKILAENSKRLPDHICVTIKMKGRVYKRQNKCKYSLIQGAITDFNGNPFPAAVVFLRKAFGGKCPYIGVWSDKSGKYSVMVPNGSYGAFYVEDNSYKISTLENWSWKMWVDGNEIHNFKIGNGEVYGLSVWEAAGGGNILFLYFRPMILPQIKRQEYTITLNGIDRKLTDIQPDLVKDNLKVFIDHKQMNLLSLQKIYETGIYNESDYTLIAYVAQIKKPALERGKHTVIVEYEAIDKYKAQSQGRTHFFTDDLL